MSIRLELHYRYPLPEYIAEATYRGYTTRGNDLSDLGATRPPNSIIKQPAATIFAVTLIVAGVLLIGSARPGHT